ncbi:MAG: hypothetical protein ACOYLT_07485 [Flavobacterium sp.]|uniref:hypothetical protein n=1 Tax=Flavobacterium sp. TaxID=239 RepID=UPI003BE6E77A
MSKETAVEWLINELTVIDFTDPFWKEKIEQAKEMEKEQIIDAYEEGYLQCTIYGLPQKSRKHYETSEQYYNETYNK